MPNPLPYPRLGVVIVSWIEAGTADTKSTVAHPAEGSNLGRLVRLLKLKVGRLRLRVRLFLVFHSSFRAWFFRASFLDISQPELQAGDISEGFHPLYLVIRLLVP